MRRPSGRELTVGAAPAAGGGEGSGEGEGEGAGWPLFSCASAAIAMAHKNTPSIDDVRRHL